MSAWLILLAVMAVPAWMGRFVVSRAFAGTFPREARWAGCAWLTWCGLVLALCYWLPSQTLPWLLLPVALGWGLVAVCDWRSRRDSRRTPPGQLSLIEGIRALGERDFNLRQFAQCGPLFKMSQFGTPTICVLGLERIERLIKGHSEFLGPSTLPISNGVEGSFLRYMPAETHAVYGKLFRRAMSGPFGSGQTAAIERLCAEQLRPLVGPPASPFPRLQTLARRALNQLLLGLEPGTRAGDRFDELARGFATAGIGWSLGRRDRESLDEMRQILAQQVDAEESRGGGSALSPSVLLRLRQQDPQMPDRICFDNLIVMHRIATGNVSSLLGWLLYRWGTEPEIVAALQQAPESEGVTGLRTFLSETLRTSQSEYLYRRVVREFEFEGYRFPRGWLLRGCVWESHRTSAVVTGPDRFRLRQEPLAYDRRHFIPLGMGAHACNGGDINELICLAFLGRLWHTRAVRVTHATPLQRQTRHWSHWQPNQALLVSLEMGP